MIDGPDSDEAPGRSLIDDEEAGVGAGLTEAQRKARVENIKKAQAKRWAPGAWRSHTGGRDPERPGQDRSTTREGLSDAGQDMRRDPADDLDDDGVGSTSAGRGSGSPPRSR